MTNYRRRFVPGGTVFFTVRLQDQSSSLLLDRIDLLRMAVSLCQKTRPFDIEDAVILPAMLHMIWRLPEHDADYATRWRAIKTTFSRHVPVSPHRTKSQRARKERGIWQRRFWEHQIRDPEDYDLHAHLIATAPLRAGLVAKDSVWPYCAAYRRKMRLDASQPKTTDPVPLGLNQATAGNASGMASNYTT